MKKEPLGDWLLMTFLRGVLYDRWAWYQRSERRGTEQWALPTYLHYPGLPACPFALAHASFFMFPLRRERLIFASVSLYSFSFCLLVVRHRWAEVVALTARAGVAVDWGALLRTRHVRHFEAMLTSRLYGYEHVDDYYRDNSSCHHFKVWPVVEAQYSYGLWEGRTRD